MRRSYQVSIVVNNVRFDEIIIDPHFEKKHQESINDEIILNLVGYLHNGEFEPIVVDNDGFTYFKTEPMFFRGKPYRLIWLIDPDKLYIGVINCFRR